VEDDWYSRHCQEGRALGTSFWTSHLEQLRDIDARHGVRPNDPRVYSIAAYQDECRAIEEEWHKLCIDKGWGDLDSTTPNYGEFLLASSRARARRDDCKARHFPGLDDLRPETIDSIPKLWEHIALHLLFVVEQVHRFNLEPNGRRPETCDKDVQRVYSVLHRLKIPWAPAPPYPSFTQPEARDELTRLANRLESEDAERCRREAMATNDRGPEPSTAGKSAEHTRPEGREDSTAMQTVPGVNEYQDQTPRNDRTGTSTLPPTHQPLPAPQVHYEPGWPFSDFCDRARRELEEWQRRRDSALRTVRKRYEGEGPTPHWARSAEALLHDLDRRWCRRWCEALQLYPPPQTIEGLRLWCDLQYSVLGLVEHSRERQGWVQWEEPPPDDEFYEPVDWPGRPITLEEAAVPVLCLLNGEESPDWAALEQEVGLLHPQPCDDLEVLWDEDLARMIEGAWVAMRAIGAPVPPEEINVSAIPAARRALDVVTNWLHHREEIPVDQWEFGVDGFRYKTTVWHKLNKQPLRLLEAFVHAKRMTLTNEEINQAATGDRETDIERPYAYVSELNKELCRIWKVQDKPVRSIRGASTYQLQPPF
jgi:hypothetical protein